MKTLQNLRHSRWDCKHHVVWIPKCRKKKLYDQLRQELGLVFHELARQKECRVIEGHLLKDHVHMLISIPPNPSDRAEGKCGVSKGGARANTYP